MKIGTDYPYSEKTLEAIAKLEAAYAAALERNADACAWEGIVHNMCARFRIADRMGSHEHPTPNDVKWLLSALKGVPAGEGTTDA